MQLEKTTIEKFSHERNDCTVIAFANAFDTTYEQAHAFLKTQGRRDGHGFASHLALKHSKIIQKQFGKKAVEIKSTYVDGRKYRQTLKVFAREHQTGTYLIKLRGHLTTMKNGNIIDRYLPAEGTRVLLAYKII